MTFLRQLNYDYFSDFRGFFWLSTLLHFFFLPYRFLFCLFSILFLCICTVFVLYLCLFAGFVIGPGAVKLRVVKEIKQYQKKWLKYVQRMDTNRIPKQALQYRSKGRRKIGRPKKRWRDQLHFEDQETGKTPEPSWIWIWWWWWWCCC